MKINEKQAEMDIMKIILTKNKEPNERLRAIIKFEENSKLSKRILTIKNDSCNINLLSIILFLFLADNLSVNIMKMKEDDEIEFPLNSIKNIEKLPKNLSAKEDENEIRIKISFVEALKWSDVYFWFFVEKLYLNFLQIFLEYSAKKQINSSSL